MKNKIILLSLLTVTNLMALNINVAVKSALENSHLLSSKLNKIDASEAKKSLLLSAYKPNLSLTYQYSKRDFENFIKKKKESLFNISLDYNLFNGFYDKYSIKSQESLTKSEVFLRNSSIADLKQQTQNAYISLLQTLKLQQVQDEAVTLLENQLKDNNNFYKQGIIPKSKYLKVKVELQSTKQEKLRADSDVIDMKNTLSSLIHREVVLTTLQESDLKLDSTLDFASYLDASLEQRSELKYLQSLKSSQKANIKAVNSSYYPKVSIALDYNKYGDEIFPNEFSYGDLGSIDDEVVGSLTLSYDLYSGGKATNQKLIHKYTIMSLNEDIKSTKQDIKLQLQHSLQKIKVTKGQIEVSKLSISEAKEHYRMTRNRFKQQLDSTTDLLDARLLLTKAENSLYQAQYDYQKAIVNFSRVMEK